MQSIISTLVLHLKRRLLLALILPVVKLIVPLQIGSLPLNFAQLRQVEILLPHTFALLEDVPHLLAG